MQDKNNISSPYNMALSTSNATVMQQAMQLTTAIAVPMALKAAMELGLLEIIEKAGAGACLSPSDIAARLVPRASNEKHASQMVDRILRLLSSYSVVTCSVTVAKCDGETKPIHGQVQRVYGLGPLACYFIQGDQDDRASLAPLFHVISDKLMTSVWYHMKDAILDGQVPFNQAYGKSPSDYIGNDEAFGPLFYSSIKEFNIIFIEKILDSYKGFEGLKSIVDVGGGNGSILKAIISKYPTIKGINFDLPHVIEKLQPYPGIENVAGDMRSSIPKGDAIFTKGVLKNLDDDQCLRVLRNFNRALPDGGKLMVVEMVIPDIPDMSIESRSAFQFELLLTNMNAWGKERTFGEFQALAKAAGFSSIQASTRAYDVTLLEFYKISGDNHE